MDHKDFHDMTSACISSINSSTHLHSNQKLQTYYLSCYFPSSSYPVILSSIFLHEKTGNWFAISFSENEVGVDPGEKLQSQRSYDFSFLQQMFNLESKSNGSFQRMDTIIILESFVQRLKSTMEESIFCSYQVH